MTSTHDLPTVTGWWTGADIEARASAGILDDGGKAEREARDAERAALWDAFVDAGIAVSEPMPPRSASEPVTDAAIAFISRTPAQLALVPIEDLLGLEQQPNIPGTTDEFPNWRRRLPGVAENLLSPDPVKARIALLRRRGDE
jgi:4-alpha-glucanotransferase